jgi:hypothetical protein
MNESFEPVAAIPVDDDTLLHSSTALHTSKNLDADGGWFTRLAHSQMEMRVHGKQLHMRFQGFRTVRPSTETLTRAPRRTPGRR